MDETGQSSGMDETRQSSGMDETGESNRSDPEKKMSQKNLFSIKKILPSLNKHEKSNNH